MGEHQKYYRFFSPTCADAQVFFARHKHDLKHCSPVILHAIFV